MLDTLNFVCYCTQISRVIYINTYNCLLYDVQSDNDGIREKKYQRFCSETKIIYHCVEVLTPYP